jgi:hypothetical protein
MFHTLFFAVDSLMGDITSIFFLILRSSFGMPVPLSFKEYGSAPVYLSIVVTCEYKDMPWSILCYIDASIGSLQSSTTFGDGLVTRFLGVSLPAAATKVVCNLILLSLWEVPPVWNKKMSDCESVLLIVFLGGELIEISYLTKIGARPMVVLTFGFGDSTLLPLTGEYFFCLYSF